MVVTSRRAVPADATTLSRIARLAYGLYIERMGGQRPAPMDADYEVLVAEAETWVAELEGEVIGFLVLVAGTDRMLLDGVAVLPSYRGQGVGRHLLLLAEDRARASGHDRLCLYTNAAMTENQRLYGRIGFRRTHRSLEQGFDRVFYEKDVADVRPPPDPAVGSAAERTRD